MSAVIVDPVRRGRALAEFYLEVAPRLFGELESSGLLPEVPRARDEWEMLALHACLRGLVAASGFGPATHEAIDALHERVLEEWHARGADEMALRIRRDALLARYREYAAVARESGRRSEAPAAERLGVAAARHLCGAPDPPAGLPELVGGLHESLAEGATETVRRSE